MIHFSIKNHFFFFLLCIELLLCSCHNGRTKHPNVAQHWLSIQHHLFHPRILFSHLQFEQPIGDRLDAFLLKIECKNNKAKNLSNSLSRWIPLSMMRVYLGKKYKYIEYPPTQNHNVYMHYDFL